MFILNDWPLSNSLAYPNHLLFSYKETNDLQAVEEWRRNRWKERQRKARIARLKSLFILHYISASNFLEDSPSAFEGSKQVEKPELRVV